MSLMLAVIAPVAQAQPATTAPPITPFDRGKMNLGLGGGSTTAFDHRYFGVGAGFGYFVLSGLELGISGVYQFGDGPSIGKVAPSIRYVAQPLVGQTPLIPYVGTFFHHWFIGDAQPDIDTVGGRAGLLYISGSLLVGLGVAAERTVSVCDTDCWYVYPDFTLGLSL